jgi:hypothetical protein
MAPLKERFPGSMRMRSERVGLLLVLICTFGSAGFLLADSASDADSTPAPEKIEAPASTPAPAESSDESHSQVPQQQSPGEVIGIPMLA